MPNEIPERTQCCVQGRNEVRWRLGQEANLVPRGRTWDISEVNVVYWRKYLWHCWDFSAYPAVIRRPHSDSAPGVLCPPCHPSLRSWLRYATFQLKDGRAISTEIRPSVRPVARMEQQGGQQPEGRAKNQKGATHFKNTVLDVRSNRLAKREMGGTDLKWGGRAPLTPSLATALPSMQSRNNCLTIDKAVKTAVSFLLNDVDMGVRRMFFRKCNVEILLILSGYWLCSANGHSQNALPFLSH